MGLCVRQLKAPERKDLNTIRAQIRNNERVCGMAIEYLNVKKKSLNLIVPENLSYFR